MWTCPFKALTGLRCPGCGLTHAAIHLMHLNFNGAFRAKALFVLIFLYIIYAVTRFLYYKKKDKNPLSDIVGKRIDMIFLVLMLIWWPARNILGI